MTRKLLVLTTTFVLVSTTIFAQTNLKDYTAGHIFHIALPDYMTKTMGLNAAATIQYKNPVKDVYGFVIMDSKEELAMVDLNYSSLNEFYETFIKDFLKEEDKRTVSQPIFEKKGDLSFVESDVTYFDKDAKVEIYYLVGIIETKSTYYKVLSWCTLENKAKFKEDF